MLNFGKKLLAWMLTMVLLLSSMPVQALASSTDTASLSWTNTDDTNEQSNADQTDGAGDITIVFDFGEGQLDGANRKEITAASWQDEKNNIYVTVENPPVPEWDGHQLLGWVGKANNGQGKNEKPYTESPLKIWVGKDKSVTMTASWGEAADTENTAPVKTVLLGIQNPESTEASEGTEASVGFVSKNAQYNTESKTYEYILPATLGQELGLVAPEGFVLDHWKLLGDNEKEYAPGETVTGLYAAAKEETKNENAKSGENAENDGIPCFVAVLKSKDGADIPVTTASVQVVYYNSQKEKLRTEEVDAGMVIMLDPAPAAPEGELSFAGWTDDSGALHSAGAELLVNQDITLTATYAPSITYVVEVEEFHAIKTVVATEKNDGNWVVTLADVLSVTDNIEPYTFTNWSIGTEMHSPGDKLILKENVTAKAMLKRIYTATFEPNWAVGTYSELTPPKSYTRKADIDGKLSLPKIDENSFDLRGEEYVFLGWCVNSAGSKGGENLVAGKEVTLTEDTTYYAIWLKQGTVASTNANFYVRNDGKIQMEPSHYPDSQYTKVATIENALRVATSVNNNKEAVKANLANEPSDDAIKTAVSGYNPDTQYVLWYVIKIESTVWHVDGVIVDKKTYYLNYDANKGAVSADTVPAAQPYPAGTVVDVEYSPLPTRNGYEFLGWDRNPNAESPEYKLNDDSKVTMPDHDVTLYAIWKANSGVKYTIYHYFQQLPDLKYVLNNNLTTTDKGMVGEVVPEGDRGKKTFVGYTLNHSTSEPDGYIVTVNDNNEGTLVISHYYNLNTHKITYKYEGLPEGSGLTPLLTDETGVCYGTEKDVPGDPTAPTNQPPQSFLGYRFKGWTNDAGINVNESNFTMPDRDVNWVGTWEKIKYKVTYRYEGDFPNGLADPADPSVLNRTAIMDESVTVAQEPTAVPGYTFGGWNANAITVTDGEFTMPANDVEFVGIWQKNGAIVVDLQDKLNEVYNGAAHTLDTWSITGATLSDQQRNEILYAISIADNKNTAIYAGEYTVADDDITGPSQIVIEGKTYDISYQGATLKIAPASLTITAGSQTWDFDGQPHSYDSYADEGLCEGDTIGFLTIIGSVTNPTGNNPEPNVPSNAVIKRGNTDVTSSYSITYVNGKLEVKPYGTTTDTSVKLRAKGAEKVYDGTPLVGSVVGYEVIGSLPDGYSFANVKMSASQTDVGRTKNTITDFDIFKDGTEIDVSGFFKVVVENSGYLEVTKRPVTLTANSAEKQYDGIALEKPTNLDGTLYTITSTGNGSGFVNGQGVESVTVEGSQLAVGSSSNTITNCQLTSATNANNYDITLAPGTLTVTPNDTAVINVTAVSGERIYNGKPLDYTNADSEYPDGYTYTGTLLNGDTLSVAVSGTITNVGQTATVLGDVKVMHGNVDVTNAYTINKTDGTLKIIPLKLTIKTDSAVKKYDGTPLTAGGAITLTEGQGVTMTSDELLALVNSDTKPGVSVGDNSNKFRVIGSQTNVGNSDNNYSLKLKDECKDNYEITEDIGRLTVNKNDELKLTAPSATKVYDGTSLTAAWQGNGTVTNLPAGLHLEHVVMTTSSTITDVIPGENGYGSVENKIESFKVYSDYGEVTSYFDVDVILNENTTNGTLTITPAPLYITTATASREYNGDPLTAANGTYSLGTSDAQPYNSNENVTLYANDVIQINVTGTVTNAAAEAVPNPYEIIWGNTKAANYTVTDTLGTLQVTPNTTAAFVIKANDKAKEYDGTALTDSGYIVTYPDGFGTDKGFEITAVVEGSATNVSDPGENKVIGYVIKKNGVDVTANFNPDCVTLTDGKLTITPRPLTVTPNGESVMYSGAAASFTSAPQANGLVQGHSLGTTFGMADTLIDVGTYTTTVSNATVQDAQGADVTGNYTITYHQAQLSITRRPILLVAGSAVKNFDGTPLSVGWAVSGVMGRNNYGLGVGDRASAVLNGSERTDVGRNEVTFASYDIRSSTRDKNTLDNYTVTLSNGLLQILDVSTTYTIRYYYNGVMDPARTEYGSGAIGQVVTSYPAKGGAGMRFIGADNVPLSLAEDSSVNVINVYYQSRDRYTIIGDLETPLAGAWMNANVGDCIE